MNIAKTVKENKISLIVIFVLWVILTIVFIAPLAYSIVSSIKNGLFSFEIFLGTIIPAITSFSTIGKVFGAAYIGTFFKCLGIFTVIYAIFATVGFFKTKEKGDYYNIEHGSSDWSQGGEQYKILSKNKGLILAQNNYLPIDKRGNVNVLVVGRFWFW